MAKSVYQHPRLYDLAFSYRDIAKETGVVRSWYRRYGRTGSKQLTSALELACGPARHGLELAKAGANVTILDSSPYMLKYALSLAEKDGLVLTAVNGDMRSFHVENRKFDLALNMIDSISHIRLMADLVGHLKCVSRHLVRGGLYVIETAKLDDDEVSKTKSQWSVKGEDFDLDVEWRSLSEARGGKSHQVIVKIVDRKQNSSVRDSFLLRAWRKEELDSAIARVDSLEIAAVFGSFSPAVSYSSKKAWRLIYVLRQSARH